MVSMGTCLNTVDERLEFHLQRDPTYRRVWDQAVLGDDIKMQQIAEATEIPMAELRALLDLWHPPASTTHLQAREHYIANLVAQKIQAEHRARASRGPAQTSLQVRTASRIPRSAPKPPQLDLLRPHIGSGALSAQQRLAILRNFDASAVNMHPLNEVRNDGNLGYLKLGPALTEVIVHAREAFLMRLLMPQVDGSLDARRIAHSALRTHQERLKGLRLCTNNDPRMLEIERLRSRPAHQFSATMNPSTGEVYLGEPDEPLPEAIAANINPFDATRLLSTLIQPIDHEVGIEPLLAQIARHFPLDALEAIQRADLTSAVVYPSNYYTQPAALYHPESFAHLLSTIGLGAGTLFFGSGDPMPALLLYEYYASRAPTANPAVRLIDRFASSPPLRQHLPGRANGFVDLTTGRLRSSAWRWARPGSSAYVLAHELVHALDYALGLVGPASGEPEFQKIYEETSAAQKSGLRHPAFPNDYAETGAVELFADAGAIFLGLYTRNEADVVVRYTRADLKRDNPALYAYFEDFFGRRIPEALSRNEINPARDWIHALDLGSNDSSTQRTDSSLNDYFAEVSRHVRKALLHNDESALNKAEVLLEEYGNRQRESARQLHLLQALGFFTSRGQRDLIQERIPRIRAHIQARSG